MTIPPPDPPRAEALEDLDTIPDRACVWGPRDRDADCAVGFHKPPVGCLVREGEGEYGRDDSP